MDKMVTTTTAQSGILWAGFGGEALGALYDLRWMVMLVLFLIFADFFLGLRESLDNGKDFRVSKAGRRTFAKMIEYMTYLLLGVLIGLAIFEPLGICDHVTTAAIALSAAAIFEVDSIAGHAFAIHGVQPKISMRKLIIKLIKKKDEDVGEVLEEVMGDDVEQKEKDNGKD